MSRRWSSVFNFPSPFPPLSSNATARRSGWTTLSYSRIRSFFSAHRQRVNPTPCRILPTFRRHFVSVPSSSTRPLFWQKLFSRRKLMTHCAIHTLLTIDATSRYLKKNVLTVEHFSSFRLICVSLHTRVNRFLYINFKGDVFVCSTLVGETISTYLVFRELMDLRRALFFT